MPTAFRTIYCPACEHACSDRAERCISCGHPLKAHRKSKPAPPPPPAPPNVMWPATVEQTARFWKGTQLAGAFAMLAGVVLFTASMWQDVPNDAVCGLAVVVGFCGFVVYAVGRIGAWWHHG